MPKKQQMKLLWKINKTTRSKKPEGTQENAIKGTHRETQRKHLETNILETGARGTPTEI